MNDVTASCSAPLCGTRVVDLSRYLPGPFCTLQLAWLGAEVITIEQPPHGDPMRQVPPLGPDGVSLAAASLARGKERRLLDLGEPADCAEAFELCTSADVVVEGFRPGVAARLGVGAEQVRGRSPRVVYCSITGYGQDGPWAQTAGHDANYEAIAGLLARTGTPDRVTLPALPVADLAGGSSATTAICAALLQRERTGEGCHIDIALTEAALAWQAFSLPTGGDPSEARGRGLLTGGLASYQPYRCEDGEWVVVAAIEPKFFVRLCELLGVRELAAGQYDPTAQEHLRNELARVFATRPAAAWHELLSSEETCTVRVMHPLEVASHPQLAARSALEGLGGSADHPAPRSPFVFDGSRSDRQGEGQR